MTNTPFIIVGLTITRRGFKEELGEDLPRYSANTPM